MNSNVGTGFNQFKAAIEEVVEALGDRRCAGAVSCEFAGRLNRIVGWREGDKYASASPYSVAWTRATDLDIAAAVDICLGTIFRIRDEAPVQAEAPWRGARLVLRGANVWLEGRGYAMLFATAGNHPQYDSRARKVVEKWSVSLTDSAAQAIKGEESAYLGKQTSVSNIRSADAASKALLKLVGNHTGAQFVAAPSPDELYNNSVDKVVRRA